MSDFFNPERLTAEERSFLSEHGIDSSELFDAREFNATGWGDRARRLGLQYGVGITCKNGHRLRARSGHCIVCRPMNIRYQSNHRQPGFVYIASSQLRRVHKIGSTQDIHDREARLRRDEYAGISDWKIIAWFESTEAQKSEMNLQSKLKKFQVGAGYQKSTGLADARELFGADLRPIWLEFKASIERSGKKRAWRDPEILKYDFARSFTAS